MQIEEAVTIMVAICFVIVVTKQAVYKWLKKL